MRRSLLLPLALTLAGCWGGYYYADVPPPPPRVEVYGIAPGPGYIWTDGYWGWRGGSHYWVPGRWQRPPRTGARWEAPRWRQDGHRYRFQQGRWRR